MQKLIYILSILIFTILILIIGCVIWGIFNPYAKALLLPLALLSVYYLLLFSFAKMLKEKKSKLLHYLIILMIIVPLISVSYGHEQFIQLSLTLLNKISN